MSDVPRRIDVEYRARFDECGADGRMRSSGYLRYAQEAAWVHAEHAGFDRRRVRGQGMTWLVRCVELDVLDGIHHGDRFGVSTEVVGWRRVWARRRSEFRTGDDRRIRALAVIDWVLMGERDVPIRVPDEVQRIFGGPDVGTFLPARVEVGRPGAGAHRLAHTVRHRDVDPLVHVNNATYVDLMEEALREGGHDDALAVEPRRYRIEYVLPAELGERVEGSAWPDDRGWAYRLANVGGDELVRARLETDPNALVGG